MKIKVSRKELDECISNVIAKIIKEEYSKRRLQESYFDDDDYYDDNNDDGFDFSMYFDDIKKDKKAKEAAEFANTQINKNNKKARKDDAAVEKSEMTDAPTADDENMGYTKISSEQKQALLQQAAQNETDENFKRLIDAGIDLSELYYLKKGDDGILVHKKRIEEPDVEFMLRHRTVGKPADANAYLSKTTLDDVNADLMDFHWGKNVGQEDKDNDSDDENEKGKENAEDTENTENTKEIAQ